MNWRIKLSNSLSVKGYGVTTLSKREVILYKAKTRKEYPRYWCRMLITILAHEIGHVLEFERSERMGLDHDLIVLNFDYSGRFGYTAGRLLLLPKESLISADNNWETVTRKLRYQLQNKGRMKRKSLHLIKVIKSAIAIWKH